MPHFGDTLRRLREQRGLTQTSLAQRAGVSNFTISNAESLPKCKWRRGTSSVVFRALDKAAPLTHEEAQEYLSLTGLTHTLAFIEETRDRARAAGFDPDTQKLPKPPDAAFAARVDAMAQTAHKYVDHLVDEKGAATVVNALQGLAAGLGVELPKPVSTAELSEPKAPKWMLVVSDELTPDGYRVRQFAPAAPAPSPPKAQSIDRERRAAP